MSDTGHIRIHRINVPPVPVPAGGELIDEWSTYGTVSAGDITADVERFIYGIRATANQPLR